MITLTRESFFNFVKEFNHELYDDPETWGNSTQYYMKHWDHHPEKPWFWSWNWPAFFFSFLWLTYRKMPLYAFFYLSFLFVCSEVYRFIFGSALPRLDQLNFVEQFSSASKPAVIFMLLLIFFQFVIAPLAATPLYFYHAKKTITSRQGGTSLVGIVVIVFIAILGSFGLHVSLSN